MSRLAPVLALLAGCTPAVVAPRPGDAAPATPPDLAAAFAPTQSGTVRGRVTWAGPAPAVPLLLGATPDGDKYGWVTKPNPFAPTVDATGGLASAIIQLAGVDPAKSRPWDIAPVAVECAGYDFRTPGGSRFIAGVARTGAEVTFVSRDPELHAVRARGAAAFTPPFPVEDSPLTRRLAAPGVVELTSGSGYFWMAADILVSDTPYASVTAADGSFTLPQVPAGTYTLSCRVRSWRATRTERDPETGLHFRQFYAPPLTLSAAVTVTAGSTAVHNWSVAESQFPKTE